MFLTVTLNAAIDKTLRVANLQIGRRHRCAPGDLQAGGKGINVARALRALGQPVVATGLAGGRAGDLIVEDLTAGGIVHQFVRIADESRSSTIVLDPAGTQVATEIVEYGPVVRPDELETFASSYSYLLGGTEAVVLAGSLPARGARGLVRDGAARGPAAAHLHGARLRGRAAAARPGRASPISSCPTRWRPRSSSASSSRRRRISCSRSSRSSRWAPAAS